MIELEILESNNLLLLHSILFKILLFKELWNLSTSIRVFAPNFILESVLLNKVAPSPAKFESL
jgi:hypothetical protein